MELLHTVGLSRPDLIDSALLRPGRLDKSLLCDIPSLSDRKEVCLSFFCRSAGPPFPTQLHILIRFGGASDCVK